MLSFLYILRNEWQILPWYLHLHLWAFVADLLHQIVKICCILSSHTTIGPYSETSCWNSHSNLTMTLLDPRNAEYRKSRNYSGQAQLWIALKLRVTTRNLKPEWVNYSKEKNLCSVLPLIIWISTSLVERFYESKLSKPKNNGKIYLNNSSLNHKVKEISKLPM